MDASIRPLVEFLFGCVSDGLSDEDEETLEFELHKMNKRLMKLIKLNQVQKDPTDCQ